MKFFKISIFSFFLIGLFFVAHLYIDQNIIRAVDEYNRDIHNQEFLSTLKKPVNNNFSFLEKTENNFDEIEMTPISSLNSMEDAVLINNDRKKKKICNKDNLYFVLGKSIFYILLFGSIIFFEYLFFQHVVLNYHIISKAELELLIIETYLPVISEIVIDSYLN